MQWQDYFDLQVSSVCHTYVNPTHGQTTTDASGDTQMFLPGIYLNYIHIWLSRDTAHQFAWNIESHMLWAHTSFPAACQVQHPAYVLAAIWRVLSLQYTHCPPSRTRPTCIASRQPHATTHSAWSDVRPWNTPSDSVMIWLLSRYLLRHTRRVSTFAHCACWRAPSQACSRMCQKAHLLCLRYLLIQE
jgi:hypothetical protein